MGCFNYTRAAFALSEADYESDNIVAARLGITDRAIRGWRSRLKTDKKLQQAYAHAIAMKSQKMITVPEAIQKALDYIQRACDQLDVTTDGLSVVTKTLETLSEVQLIDLKLQELKSQQSQEE
jgi:hypothetical protein